jgi:hypothetical protein
MTNFSKQLILNPKTINGIEFLKPVDALSKFGSNAKHGAFIFDIMEGVELFSLLDLFSYYSIKSEDQNLPVCLNNDFITDASKLLADITIIKSMKVVAGRYWFYTSRIDAPQRYINIATK